uniref:DNA-directed DNA polymerase family A palm domain-containing protein n=1 Tax=Caulerpa cliftonii TaxID=1004391 RepID=A0A1C9JBQ5_9CHLO|nr:hypothetical protein [Caulerpa cliftonii]AOP19271.1 hypothetical protein [Caulerpa cliftonii]
MAHSPPSDKPGSNVFEQFFSSSPDNTYLSPEEHKFLSLFLNTKSTIAQRQQCKNLNKHIDQESLKVFPQWEIYGADTGPVTVKSPPIQQIPRDTFFRELFVSGSGESLIIQDLSMIELIIFAVLAKETKMLDVFDQAQDLHTFFAAIFLNIGYDQLIPEKETHFNQFKKLRNLMKRVNFGMVYLMGVKSLYERMLK